MAFTYIDAPYMLLKYDARVVVQLTNDDDQVDFNDPVNVRTTVLEAAENDAAQTVDNHLRFVYPLPLSGATLTPEIKGIVAALTWCNLWERRGEEPDTVTELRKRMFDRLKAMGDPNAPENRGNKDTSAYPVRSKAGKAATMFDYSGYFDGLPFRGKRTLPADTEPSGSA